MSGAFYYMPSEVCMKIVELLVDAFLFIPFGLVTWAVWPDLKEVLKQAE